MNYFCLMICRMICSRIRLWTCLLIWCSLHLYHIPEMNHLILLFGFRSLSCSGHLYLPVAASTKDVSRLMSNACLNASSSILTYEFFFAIFLNNLSLVFAGNFFTYSTITVLLSCLLGDILNATLWITSYLWLNVTNGSFMENCMFCSLVAASVLLGISE